MPGATRFLSRLLGCYCLIMAVVMLLRRAATIAAITALLHDPALLYALGIILIFAGLAMVLVHNRWSGRRVALIVTLIAWLTLLKGLLLICGAPGQIADLYLRALQYAHYYSIYALATLVLGIYLTFAGFRAAAE